MMGHREPMKGGDEVDAFCRSMRNYLWRNDSCHQTKTRFSRRIRHAAKRSLQDEVREAFGS